jgi:hypothetical protein
VWSADRSAATSRRSDCTSVAVMIHIRLAGVAWCC